MEHINECRSLGQACEEGIQTDHGCFSGLVAEMPRIPDCSRMVFGQDNKALNNNTNWTFRQSTSITTKTTSKLACLEHDGFIQCVAFYFGHRYNNIFSTDCHLVEDLSAQKMTGWISSSLCASTSTLDVHRLPWQVLSAPTFNPHIQQQGEKLLVDSM